jgi:hypothetical protein
MKSEYPKSLEDVIREVGDSGVEYITSDESGMKQGNGVSTSSTGFSFADAFDTGEVERMKKELQEQWEDPIQKDDTTETPLLAKVSFSPAGTLEESLNLSKETEGTDEHSVAYYEGKMYTAGAKGSYVTFPATLLSALQDAKFSHTEIARIRDAFERGKKEAENGNNEVSEDQNRANMTNDNATKMKKHTKGRMAWMDMK